MRVTRIGRSEGFSFVDIMFATSVGVLLTVASVPVARTATDSLRLTSAAHTIERELHAARLAAVSSNRRVRLRLNCPADGQVRRVEVTAGAANAAASDRCDLDKYPYPGPSDGDQSTPAHDGPVQTLNSAMAVGGPDIEFTPRGTAELVVGGTAQALAGEATLTVTAGKVGHKLTINGMGRVAIQ